jgi:uncharacterized membrane protein YkvA (DUF1232 family)
VLIIENNSIEITGQSFQVYKIFPFRFFISGSELELKWFETLKARARTLKRDVIALWYAYRDPSTPWYAKIFSAVVVAYALSPIDLIPDFVPLLGYLDDLILIPAGIALALKMIPADVMEKARLKADEQQLNEKPTNWVAGVLILAIWGAILFFVLRTLYRIFVK